MTEAENTPTPVSAEVSVNATAGTYQFILTHAGSIRLKTKQYFHKPIPIKGKFA